MNYQYMVKKLKKSPASKNIKKIEAPAVVHSGNDLFSETVHRTREKYCTVSIVSSPFIITEEYRQNYSDVFKHE